MSQRRLALARNLPLSSAWPIARRATRVFSVSEAVTVSNSFSASTSRRKLSRTVRVFLELMVLLTPERVEYKARLDTVNFIVGLVYFRKYR